MQKEVVPHQQIVDLWHNLLQDALETRSLYGLSLQTVLNQGGGGNRRKRSKRGKKTPVQRLCLALLKTLYKKTLLSLLSYRSTVKLLYKPCGQRLSTWPSSTRLLEWKQKGSLHPLLLLVNIFEYICYFFHSGYLY